MRARAGTALVAIALTVGAVILAISNGPAKTSSPETSPAKPSAATPVAAAGSRSAVENCSTRSEADFPGAFTSPRNLVVGPLVLVGGAYTDPATVREFGGNKFPLLVKAGHTVTVRIPAPDRRDAGLAYGPLPEGETKLRDTYASVKFIACRRGTATRRSGSYADGVAVTFWSGFVLTRTPACIPLDVYLDGASTPRRVGLSLGRRCTS